MHRMVRSKASDGPAVSVGRSGEVSSDGPASRRTTATEGCAKLSHSRSTRRTVRREASDCPTQRRTVATERYSRVTNDNCTRRTVRRERNTQRWTIRTEPKSIARGARLTRRTVRRETSDGLACVKKAREKRKLTPKHRFSTDSSQTKSNGVDTL